MWIILIIDINILNSVLNIKCTRCTTISFVTLLYAGVEYPYSSFTLLSTIDIGFNTCDMIYHHISLNLMSDVLYYIFIPADTILMKYASSSPSHGTTPVHPGNGRISGNFMNLFSCSFL